MVTDGIMVVLSELLRMENHCNKGRRVERREGRELYSPHKTAAEGKYPIGAYSVAQYYALFYSDHGLALRQCQGRGRCQKIVAACIRADRSLNTQIEKLFFIQEVTDEFWMRTGEFEYRITRFEVALAVLCGVGGGRSTFEFWCN
jgi:hypothetical protein